MSTSKTLTASFATAFALVALTSLSGCAETVTASSRISGGSGGMATLAGGREANTPAPVEARQAERPSREREAPAPRESRFARFEFQCRMCR